MGFRKDAYATVWSNEAKGKYYNAKITISRKDKETGEYTDDFNDFVRFVGKAAEKAEVICERDRIQIKECDVTTKYDKEKGKQYTNFIIYDFDKVEKKSDSSNTGE